MTTTRIDAVAALTGLLFLLRNEWNPEGLPRELCLRHEIAEEITAALEAVLPLLLEPAVAALWPKGEEER